MSFGVPKKPAGYILERRLVEKLNLRFEKTERERCLFQGLFSDFSLIWKAVSGLYPNEDMTLAFYAAMRQYRKATRPLIHNENALRNILIVEGRAAAHRGHDELNAFWSRRTPQQQDMLSAHFTGEWQKKAGAKEQNSHLNETHTSKDGQDDGDHACPSTGSPSSQIKEKCLIILKTKPLK